VRLKAPSPSMVVSVVALVFAATGSAVAAVDFARNAGAVDGKSAVSSSATRSHAAGRLVATAGKGPLKGRIPSKFLDLGGTVRGAAASFGRALPLGDNQTLAPINIGSVPEIGSVTAACADENGKAGLVDPSATLTFANTSGDAVNLSRSVDNQPATVTVLLNNTVDSFKISGSKPFELHMERKGTNYVVNGVFRQDGRNTPSANCLIYGYSIAIPAGG
jgi:hypothetical protein